MTGNAGRLPRVVVDTNVLVSGVIVPHGLPRQLLDAWERDELVVVTAPELIAEVERILLDTPHGLRRGILGSTSGRVYQARAR